MDLNWLEDLLALAETRNFSRAANARHVTQPAFSRRIQSLEAWAGTPLVDRSPNGIALNPAGQALHARAPDILRDLHQARRSAQKAGARNQPPLTIAATHALSFTFFPTWIRTQAPLETLGTINLVSDTMAACERILLDGETDFLLCHHHPAAPSAFDPARFRSIPVGTDSLIPVTAPGFPTLPGTQTNPLRFLAYSPASGLGRILQAAQTRTPQTRTPPNPTAQTPTPQTPTPRNLHTVFTSPLAAALQTMARQGHGIAWLPLSLAEQDLAAGRLIPAGTPSDTIPLQIRLFRAPILNSPQADLFWNTVSSPSPLTPR